MMSGLLLGLCRIPAGPALADEPMELRESLSAGTQSQVRIELKAEGLFRPGLSSGALAGRGDHAQASGARRSDQAGFHRATARFRCCAGWCWRPTAKRVRIGRQASVQRKGGSLGHTGGCRDQWRGQAHGK